MESLQNRLVMIGAEGIPRTWERLFAQALILVGEIAKHGRKDPFWTFGGGTVLMLRYGHRFSKDIDIFVPDPQSLGFVNPRLSDVAESITDEYTEGATYIKLYLSEGEIDFVASPNLTSPGFVMEKILGQSVRVETSAEIIAKKLWHRGHNIAGRDIFDFALVAEKELESLFENAAYMVRHADAIILAMSERYEPLRAQFEAVDAIGFHPSFDDACKTLTQMLQKMKEQLHLHDVPDNTAPDP